MTSGFIQQKRQLATSMLSASPAAASIPSSNSSSSNLVSIQVTPPTMCQTMNITFDPNRGVPPFDVVIAWENWYAQRIQSE